ncbi:MAG TPA: GGDEF domain-containing protein [Terracidiphilus sp.]|jgi:diguanylate cyclase (GGDEF)-like protein|nr:GGDEF domain-containing protein [Terracidiphilus sp.]
MMHAEGARLRGAVAGAFFMRKAVAILALIVSCAFASAQQTPLASVHAIRALTDEQAHQGLPVDFQATVTYVRSYQHALFVADGDSAVYVEWPTESLLGPGDRVQVTGTTTSQGLKPSVVAKSVTLLHHGTLPAPVPATFDQLVNGDMDARLVTVNAIVRDANTVVNQNVRSSLLQLHADGGEIDAAVDVDNQDFLGTLLDAEVQVTGTVSGRFDSKMQQTGIVLHVSSMDGVKVVRHAASSPWELPITPMDQILSGYHINNSSRRIRVRGTITYYQPGSSVVLQDGDKSLWLMTSSFAPLHVGNAADATGFPDVHDGLLALASAEVQDSGKQAPITPRQTTWDQLSTGKSLFDLVTIDGSVVAEVRGAAQDEYIVEANGDLFSAIYRHPTNDDGDGPGPLKHVDAGAKVRVTGVCISTHSASPVQARVPFNILLRSPDDIAVVTAAPWLTVAVLAKIVGALFLVVLAFSVWALTLRRRVRQQTEAITQQSEADAEQQRRIAELERRRSRVLEDINSSRPLGDIVEHITEMVSFMLHGAPCWCQVTEGPLLGRPPANKTSLRVISSEIQARSGLVLGTLYAGLESMDENEKEEQDALTAGIGLATLSIETRKLYSDLVHRSEFDLLTDMFNRFSLDRHLLELIDKAHETSSSFGLIYVDLDDFKLVNDMYGHHIGDLYLQEVSLRMKRQLRTGDVLGRLGGDEFAALVTVVRGRIDVEEIAQRLERCFDAPFTLNGYELRGAASVGMAIYPTDGTTSDALMTAADTQMYAAKNSRRGTGKMSSRR